MSNLIKRLKTGSPYVMLIALLAGAAGLGAAGALIVGHLHGASSADATADEPIPYAARLDRLDGEVGIGRQAAGEDQLDWTKATLNTPVSIGDRLYVEDGSRASIAFGARNYARLDPMTSLDVLSLSEDRTQLALREGSCFFDIGALEPNEFFEVATPHGAGDFVQPGLDQLGIDDGGNTLVSVLNGLARVAGLAGSGEITKGQLLTLAGATAAEAYVAHLSSDVAGRLADDYYSYRCPRIYDGRYSNYDTYLSDPYYYETYRRSRSYGYVPVDDISGLYDLDDYGDWQDVPGYGHCWHPHVSAGWVPYRDGYWSNDYPLGLTWVSNERWGWAPYHYGRWAYSNDSWYWVPGDIVKRHFYAPALVAFVQLPRADRVGWLPLGPGDPYVPRYYDADYRPRYIDSRVTVNRYVNVTKVVNYQVPGAVTVVSTTQFTRVISPSDVATADRALLARTRPVVDPFAVPSLRQLAPHMEATRTPVAVPVAVRQRLRRAVVASESPVIPKGVVTDLRATRGVRALPPSDTNKKLRIKKTDRAVARRMPNGLPASPAPVVAPSNQGAQNPANNSVENRERNSRIRALAPEAAKGAKAARREMRKLERQQAKQQQNERNAAVQQQLAQQAQQAERRKSANETLRRQKEQAAQQAKLKNQAQRAQKKAERQHAREAQQQQRNERKVQRQANRREAQQQAQQQQSAKELRKTQRRAERQNVPKPPPPAVKPQRQEQQNQRRAEKQQRQQQRQSKKAERKKNKNSN
jgi:hypothetical protein